MSIFYIVSTPIGNLEDITLRALSTLKEVDLILAEDTRVAKILLNHYGIKKDVIRYDEHKHSAIEDMVLESLREGSNIALITDAGTPTISDPGHRIVKRILDIQKELPEISVKAIPGASSLVSALSVSGISADHFTFYGFIPHKKGKETILKDISASSITSVFFESPHRLMKTLEMLKKFISDVEREKWKGAAFPFSSREANITVNTASIDWDRNISVIRELTKIHESVVHGTIREVYDYFTIHTDEVRGEIIVVVDKNK